MARTSIMSEERPVSPVGTSRFEQPYILPSSSTAASPKTPYSFDSRRYNMHLSKPSNASTIDSNLSDYNDNDLNGYSTAPTSLTGSPVEDFSALPKPHPTFGYRQHVITEQEHDSNLRVVDTDEWFARFRSDSELGEPITDECPDRATLAAAYNIPIYSSDGGSIPFGELYHPATATHTRQLVIFVRHFYCGACQAYLKAISDNITMSEYFSIPTPTSIIVIGCGHPELIPFYKAKTGCPFPIFADPSRALFKRLGMSLSGNIGMKRPEYMKDISPVAWAAGQYTTIRDGVKARQAALREAKMEEAERRRQQQELAYEVEALDQMERDHQRAAESMHGSRDGNQTDGPLIIRKRDVVKGGNPFQIGGEFLFEEGEVIWCHRMKNYRNHAEVDVIRKVLELDE